MNPNRALGLYILALIVVAGVTYFTFFENSSSSRNGRIILDITKEQIERLEYHTENKELYVEPHPSGKGFQITLREQDSSTKTDESLKVTLYRASTEFEQALEHLFPLSAARDLGKVDDKEKIEEFGLSHPQGRINLASKNKTIVLSVGKQTYGGKSYYIKKQTDKRVFLVSSRVVRVLDFSSPRYMERHFLGSISKQVDQIDINCREMDKQSRLIRKHKEASGNGYWVRVGKQTSDDELYGNWVTKLFTLKVQAYLDNLPEGLNKGCTLMLQKGNKQLDELEVRWKEEAGGKREFFGRSKFVGIWVKLTSSSASTVISDLASVVGNNTTKNKRARK